MYNCICVLCIFFFWFFLCSFFPSVLWYCCLGLLTCKTHLPYNVYCVGGYAKPCTIQSNRVVFVSVWSGLRQVVVLSISGSSNFSLRSMNVLRPVHCCLLLVFCRQSFFSVCRVVSRLPCINGSQVRHAVWFHFDCDILSFAFWCTISRTSTSICSYCRRLDGCVRPVQR